MKKSLVKILVTAILITTAQLSGEDNCSKSRAFSANSTCYGIGCNNNIYWVMGCQKKDGSWNNWKQEKNIQGCHNVYNVDGILTC